MKRLLSLFTGLLLFLFLNSCSDKSHSDPAMSIEELRQLRNQYPSQNMNQTFATIDSLELAGDVLPPLSDYWRALVCDSHWRYRLALYYYQKALDSYQEPISDWHLYSDIYYRTAIMYYNMQDVNKAMNMMMDLVAKADSLEAIGSDAFPRTVFSFAIVFIADSQLKLGQVDEAKKNCLKAYQLLQETKPTDFINLMINCSNMVETYITLGDWDEADVWLTRATEAYNHLRTHRPSHKDISDLLLEYEKSFSLHQAFILHSRGLKEEARLAYKSVNDSNLMNHPHNIYQSISYLMEAGYYDEALTFMNRYDTLSPSSDRPEISFSIIQDQLVPRFQANLKAGHRAEALTTADEICQAMDSAIARQNRDATAEFSIIYQTHEKERALQLKEQAEHLHINIIFGLVLILVTCITLLWHIYVAKRKLHEKNIQLFETIQQMMNKEQQAVEQIQDYPEDSLTSSQRLYKQLVELMHEKQPYTNSDLKREDLALMLGTNYSYLADAIRDCSGMTIVEFLDDYRVRHAAQKLAQTDDPIGIIIDSSGFNSRSHFNSIFRERYKITPSEYRRIAQEK